MDQQELPGMPEPQTPRELYEAGLIDSRTYVLMGLFAEIEEFDPNEVDYRFASYVPFRSMKFKVHKTLAHARSSTSADAGGIYEMIDGRWVMLEVSHGKQILKDYR